MVIYGFLRAGKGKTGVIDKVYKDLGGDVKRDNEPATFDLAERVDNVDQDKFFGNPRRPDKYNRRVTQEGQWLFMKENEVETEQDLVHRLLGDFIWGYGPENLVFPHNGKFASILKKSIMVGEAAANWVRAGEKDGNYNYGMNLRGEINVSVSSGYHSLEHFIGSASIRISKVSDKEIKMEIFNITSITSGYLLKDIPVVNWFVETPRSVTHSRTYGIGHTYSNTSQYFSFSMSITEAEKLAVKFGATLAEK